MPTAHHVPRCAEAANECDAEPEVYIVGYAADQACRSRSDTLIVGGTQIAVSEMAKAFLLRNIPVILTLAFAFAATVAAGALFSALIVTRSMAMR